MEDRRQRKLHGLPEVKGLRIYGKMVSRFSLELFSASFWHGRAAHSSVSQSPDYGTVKMFQDFAERLLFSCYQCSLIPNCPTVHFIFYSYLSNYFINRETITQEGLYGDLFSQKSWSVLWEAALPFSMQKIPALELCLAGRAQSFHSSETSQVQAKEQIVKIKAVLHLFFLGIPVWEKY